MAVAIVSSPWWMVVLAAIGLLAIAAVLVSLFLSLGRRPERLRTALDAHIGSEEFVTGLAGLLNVPALRGGRIDPIEDGPAIADAIVQAIDDARATINFTTYFWQEGEVSRRIWRALVSAAERGVEVRLLLDGFGGATADGERITELVDAGGAVGWFRPAAFGKLNRFHRRNHRRAIVIDGTIGFTGGWGVGDQWLPGEDGEPGWRDTMYGCRGTVASGIQSAFAYSWAHSEGEILLGERFFPPTVERESAPAHLHVVSSPADEAHPVRKTFFLSIDAARERVLMGMAYFAPDRELRRLLRRKAREGVEVVIVTAGEQTDARPVWYAGRAYYQSLLAAGVRIFEYEPAHYHRKVLTVDGAWTVVGSANFDIRSKELNEENLLAVADQRLARQTEESIWTDSGRSAEIKLEEWRNRGLKERGLERFFEMFAEQY